MQVAQRQAANWQREQGEAERERLTYLAIERGEPVRTEYHIVLGSPLSPEVIEDTAMLLGRVFRHVKGRYLDVPKTVRATIDAGGQVHAMFLPQRYARELLVLYHEGETRPYLPAFHALVRKWQRLGVRLSLYPFERHPGELRTSIRGRSAPTLELLAQRHEGCTLMLFASHLAVKGTAILAWPTYLRAFPLRVWLDPDPRPVSDRARESQASIHYLDRLLPRFPMTGTGLTALARFLAADGIGVKLPEWEPLPFSYTADTQMREALTTWIALAALVPDAHWLQFEGLRQMLLAEQLPDPRSIRCVIEELSILLGATVSGSSIGVEFPPQMRSMLLLWIKQHRPDLTARAFALLESWLGPPPKSDIPGEKTLLQCDWEWRRAWYQSGQHRENRQVLLTPLLGGPMHSRAAECLELLEGASRYPNNSAQSVLPILSSTDLMLQKFVWQTALLALVPTLLAVGVWVLAARKTTYEFLRPPAEIVRVTIPKTPYERVIRMEGARSTTSRPALSIITPGIFDMGSPENEPERDRDELQHRVTITRRFLMMTTEVTQAQYQAIMSENPAATRIDCRNRKWSSAGVGPNYPVYCVDFFDVLSYANRLSEQEGLERCYSGNQQNVDWSRGGDCLGYRLPTEAEWEYAARASDSTPFAGGETLDEVAWYGKNAEGQARPVGKKRANRWGLYDLSGNVWEWVWDGFEPFKAESYTNPTGPSKISYRVVRGGSWKNDEKWMRIAYRDGRVPEYRATVLGFRLVRSYPQSSP